MNRSLRVTGRTLTKITVNDMHPHVCAPPPQPETWFVLLTAVPLAPFGLAIEDIPEMSTDAQSEGALSAPHVYDTTPRGAGQESLRVEGSLR